MRPDIYTAEPPFHFTQNVGTDVYSGKVPLGFKIKELISLISLIYQLGMTYIISVLLNACRLLTVTKQLDGEDSMRSPRLARFCVASGTSTRLASTFRMCPPCQTAPRSGDSRS